ncbi:lysostaphin resistance A-like protein [Haloarcula japonica]|jgi:membrane protease YdiL (CAAX protease family)|uniref:CPBP family intramembrane metalloprotease n=1 Tax=Halobaculum magnesiiphilum TaxID=1017351 RepID=A0A8T8WHH0_9EURY|nr:CPBP family intramembrane metalloprotease [Halobaculum magnesiiphilum]
MSSISRFRSVASAIGLTYGSYVAGAIVILAVGTVVGLFGVDLTSRPALRLVVSTFFLQGVTFGGIAVLYLKGRDLGLRFVPVRLPDKRDGAVIVGGSIAILGLLFVASSVITALGLNSAQNQIVEVGRQNPSVFLLLIPLQFLLVGPGEELLFRGLVQGTLRESLHPARAIILASALFASIHLFSLSGEGKLVYIGIAFVLALVLGAAYEYTDNLTVPAVIHGTYNAVQFAGAYLTATGGL